MGGPQRNRLSHQNPQGVRCNSQRLAGGIDPSSTRRPRHIVARARPRAGDGRQRVAALRILDRLDLDAGAGVAHPGADLPVRHVLRPASRRARARRRGVPVFHPRNKLLVEVITSTPGMLLSIIVIVCRSLRQAVLDHRRGHRQSRRHRIPLHRQVAHSDWLRVVLFPIAVSGDQELSRNAGSLMFSHEVSPS